MLSSYFEWKSFQHWKNHKGNQLYWMRLKIKLNAFHLQLYKWISITWTPCISIGLSVFRGSSLDMLCGDWGDPPSYIDRCALIRLETLCNRLDVLTRAWGKFSIFRLVGWIRRACYSWSSDTPRYHTQGGDLPRPMKRLKISMSVSISHSHCF
jgi:hypothetical protein